jgi:hypothetical protein
MKFVMQRDKVVATRHGHALGFKKGVPLNVPATCWEDVQAAGAVPVDELPAAKDDEPPRAPQGAERAALIVAAAKALVLKGDRESFTAAGSPHAAALSKEVGFAVDAKERDAAWLVAQQEPND